MNQLAKLNRLLAELWECNVFYGNNWRQWGLNRSPLASLSDLSHYPLVTRDDLLADQQAQPPLGTNLTARLTDCKRFLRSSGTTRAPLYWADTPDSWHWVLHCSQSVYELAGITPSDRLFFLMNFGPSSGPWILYEGAGQLGCACFTCGSANDDEAARWIQLFRPNVIVGKPSRLKQLTDDLLQANLDLKSLKVEKIITVSESDGPNTPFRKLMADSWGAECFNRYGLTEAGSVAGECTAHPNGLHLLNEYIAEIIDPNTEQPLPEGEPGELVLTNLGRTGRPLIRYRTGDFTRLVRSPQCTCGRQQPLLSGGITRFI